MNPVLVPAHQDGIPRQACRLFEEAAKLGQVHALVFADELCPIKPRFNQDERLYLTQSLKSVTHATTVNELPKDQESRLILSESDPLAPQYPDAILIPQQTLESIPEPTEPAPTTAPKVVVTGCFDYLHGGHLRFFEEAAEHGELHVVVGSDANVSLLKGPHHPLYSEAVRRYQVACLKPVHAAYVSSGTGWLDAEPEIAKIKPQSYIVNEDGHKPEKENFCQENDINYLVLKRTPKQGLPPRSSTELRGF